MPISTENKAAKYDTGEEIAAKIVDAEPMRVRGESQRVGQVFLIGIAGLGDQGRKDRHQDDHTKDQTRHHRRLVVGKAPEGEVEGAALCGHALPHVGKRTRRRGLRCHSLPPNRMRGFKSA
jgi:hypothetical protein